MCTQPGNRNPRMNRSNQVTKDITIHVTINPDQVVRYELTVTYLNQNGAYCD